MSDAWMLLLLLIPIALSWALTVDLNWSPDKK